MDVQIPQARPVDASVVRFAGDPAVPGVVRLFPLSGNV